MRNDNDPKRITPLAFVEMAKALHHPKEEVFQLQLKGYHRYCRSLISLSYCKGFRPVIMFSRRRMFGCLLSSLALKQVCQSQAATQYSTGISPWKTWIAYYGADGDCDALSNYDMVVLDPAFQGSIRQCQRKGAKVLGYISLGEINSTSALFPLLQDQSALLSKNADWPGAFRVDVRRPSWRALILEKGIPALIERGFSGLFFDTLDTPPYLEQIDPERFAGMRMAAIELVRSIRRRFPNVILAMNRGYDLLPDVAGDIDAVIAESLLTSHSFGEHKYRWLEPQLVEQQKKLLEPARKRPSPLPVLSLDYWDPSDTKTIREIYQRERSLGNVPYVSVALLDRIIPEPRS